MQKRISRTKLIFFTASAILLLCILSCGIVFAKYLNEKTSAGVVVAKNFYFTSNFLDGKSHTLAPGSTSVTFTVGNHTDDLRYSDMDIKYTVTVDNGATIAEGTKTGTLAKGAVNDAEITVSDLLPGTTYTVTATGEGGYRKTLTATIVVPQNEAQLYYFVDNSSGEYTLLTVWNEGDKAGEATIKYTGIPDNTNPNMVDWTDTTKKTNKVTIGPHESKVFRFFGETEKIKVNNATEKNLY